MKKIISAVFIIGLLSTNLALPLCWGAENVSANPTINLDVKNEPLRGVLGKISQATGWKINAPEKWLGKPVNQTLKQASMEEGLRSVLNSAGIENLLLLYNEDSRVVTIFDTEGAQGQSANRPLAHASAQTQASSANSPVAEDSVRAPSVAPAADPILSPSAGSNKPGPLRRTRRGARHNSTEED